ncbi:MAG TPA: thioredoxin domain-containing protein [Caulobacteraceae bacterium]|nr:thioredoxin domain-containing protein [Caulobacteraceae bacterium]
MLRVKVASAIVIAAIFMVGCARQGPGALPDDMSLGSAEAKVEVVEYASVGCPICGRWAREVYPAFKAKYVDTGKVHYVFREMLVGAGSEVSIAAAGFLMARCAGPDKYFPVVDAIFTNQDAIFASPRGALAGVAKEAGGLGEEAFAKCVSDEKALASLNERTKQNAEKGGVNATPTFVINGVSMAPGYHTLPEIDAAIAGAPVR